MKITEKLQPFTHLMGCSVSIPGAPMALEIFPTRLGVVGGESVDLPITGPISNFVAIQDLEKGRIRVSFRSQEGFIRYSIYPGPILELKKGDIELPWQGEVKTPSLPAERLSFGSHKKLDWELVQRRGDPKEIWPIWHRLGLMLACDKSLPNLLERYSSSFYGLMVPSATDPFHQGMPAWEIDNPYLLLAEGARQIRALFFQEEGGVIHLLPSLPKTFHAGKMHGISTSLGTLSFEWSKHRLRIARLTCTQAGTLKLALPKEVKRFRLNGEWVDAAGSHAVLEGEVFLDRFER